MPGAQLALKMQAEGMDPSVLGIDAGSQSEGQQVSSATAKPVGRSGPSGTHATPGGSSVPPRSGLLGEIQAGKPLRKAKPVEKQPEKPKAPSLLDQIRAGKKLRKRSEKEVAAEKKEKEAEAAAAGGGVMAALLRRRLALMGDDDSDSDSSSDGWDSD